MAAGSRDGVALGKRSARFGRRERIRRALSAKFTTRVAFVRRAGRVGRAQSRSLPRAPAMFRAGRRGRALLALLPYSRVRATDVAGCRTEIHVSRSNARGEAPEGSCHTALKSGLA